MLEPRERMLKQIKKTGKVVLPAGYGMAYRKAIHKEAREWKGSRKY